MQTVSYYNGTQLDGDGYMPSRAVRVGGCRVGGNTGSTWQIRDGDRWHDASPEDLQHIASTLDRAREQLCEAYARPSSADELR